MRSGRVANEAHARRMRRAMADLGEPPHPAVEAKLELERQIDQRAEVEPGAPRRHVDHRAAAAAVAGPVNDEPTLQVPVPDLLATLFPHDTHH
jgi:hypothetical protein